MTDKGTKFMRELEETLDILQEDTLTPETRFRDLPGWDSLASLTTLSVFDEVYSHQVSGEELKKCETIGDLLSLAPEEKGE